MNLFKKILIRAKFESAMRSTQSKGNGNRALRRAIFLTGASDVLDALEIGDASAKNRVILRGLEISKPYSK